MKKNDHLNIFLGSIIGSTLIYIYQFQLAKNLTLEEYGLFSLYYGFISIAMPLILFGQATALTVASYSSKKINRSIKKELNFSFLIIIISLFCVFLVSNSLHFFKVLNFSFSILFSSLLLSFFLAIRQLNNTFLLVTNSSKEFLVQQVLALFLVLVFSFLFPHYIGFMICFSLIGSAILFSYPYKLKEVATFTYSVKSMARLGFFAIPGMLITTANTQIDRFILNKYLPLELIAQYSFSATFGYGLGLLFINSLLKSNSLALLTYLSKEDTKNYSKVLKQSEFLIFLFFIISIVFIKFLSSSLISFFINPKFSNSTDILMYMMSISAIVGLSMLHSQPLIQREKLSLIVVISFLGLVFNIALAFILVPYLDVKGVIISLFTSAIVQYLLSLYYVKKIAYKFYFKSGIVYFLIITLFFIWCIV